MNRGLIVALIVVGVAAAGGGAAYYFTETSGDPGGIFARTVSLEAATVATAPHPPPPLAPAPADEPETASLEKMIAALDLSANALVWVMPPGVHALGPWEADVAIRHNGDLQYQTSIPLRAETLRADAYPDLPRGAETIRLSAGANWTAVRDEIRQTMDALTAEHGSGGGDLQISSNLATEIVAGVQDAYCVEDRMPSLRLYLEQGDPPALTQLEIGAAEPLLRGAILSGCPTGTTPAREP